MPSTASTSTPCRSACCLKLLAVARRSAPWITVAISRIAGIANTSTQPSGPPMMKVIATNSTMNGRSEMADIVAEAKKSRTSSICASWCA